MSKQSMVQSHSSIPIARSMSRNIVVERRISDNRRTQQRTVADNKFLVWFLAPIFPLFLKQITFLKGSA